MVVLKEKTNGVLYISTLFLCKNTGREGKQLECYRTITKSNCQHGIII